RTYTRFDFGLQLVEPLQRFVALVEAQETPTIGPAQRRRADLAYKAVSGLSDEQFSALLGHARALCEEFRAAIEALAPGLPLKANIARGKLREPRYQPWKTPAAAPAAAPKGANVHYALEPRLPDPIGNPLPLLPAQPNQRGILFFTGGAETDNRLLGTRAIDSMAAAIDVAFSERLRVYGMMSTMPGDDPMLLLKPDASRRAMLGVRFDLGHLNELGLTGIFEYHMMRTGNPDNPNIDHGAVTGVGLTW
ncbi:MAG TPA: hypothetical protein PLZ36_07015, partial [Armatimonadota bacterium]|nr:hypothetical protein [Armatimonadota bacterium]